MKRFDRARTGTPLLLLFAMATLFPAGCSNQGIVEPSAMESNAPLAAMHAAAQTDHGKWKAFEVLQTNHGPPPPFETRLRGNTRHDLSVQVRGVLAGDIVGTFTAIINAYLHGHPEKEGVFVGPARLDGTWVVTELFGEPVTGTFEVSGHGHRELPGPFTGRLTGKGTGDLAGLNLQADFENGPAPATFVIKGRILDP
jgi:hypothetical protein